MRNSNGRALDALAAEIALVAGEALEARQLQAECTLGVGQRHRAAAEQQLAQERRQLVTGEARAGHQLRAVEAVSAQPDDA